MVTRVGKESVSIYGAWMACVADVSKTEILVSIDIQLIRRATNSIRLSQFPGDKPGCH